MKKKTKNVLYKVGIGLGGLTTIVAPLATSVSFAGNAKATANVGGPEWQAYIDKINDKTTETTLSDDFNAIKPKFTGSQFYKNQVELTNGVWDLKNSNDIYASLVTLLESDEFSISEKIVIGKYIINNEAIDDLFENLGFDKSIVTTSDAIKAVSGNFPDITHPANTNSSITMVDWANNQTTTSISLKGKTGFNLSFSPLTFHDKELEISNADALSYFIKTMALTHEYQDWHKSISSAISNFLTSSGGDYASIFNNYFTNLNNLVEKITDTPDELTKLSCFGALKSVDLTNVTSDDDVIVKILSSDLGKVLFGTELQDTLDTYNDASKNNDQDGRNATAVSIMTKINAHYTALNRVESQQIMRLQNLNPQIFASQSGIDAFVLFAKLLSKQSNNFTLDVQLHSRTSILGNHSLSIKGDFNSSAWTTVDKNFKVPYWVLSDTPLNMSQKFSDGINQDPLVQTKLSNGTINKKVDYDDKLKKESSEKIVNVKPVNGWYHSNFLFRLTTNGKSSDSNTLIDYKPTDGPNSTSSFQLFYWNDLNFTFSNNNGILTFDTNNIPTFNDVSLVIINEDDKSKSIEINLPDLTNSLNKALLEVKNQVQNIDVATIPGFDPNAAISRTISITNLKNAFFQYYIVGTDTKVLGDVGIDKIDDISFDFSYSITQNPEIS